MTDHINTREIVLDMLMSVSRDHEPSHRVLNQMLEKYQYLENQERRFISRLFKGTLERLLTLDYCIEQFSTVKISKMKPLIRNLLRMSVYQLLYMHTIPHSAVCNEAVKLAARRGFKTLKGFVNGVLRNISRQAEQIKWPDETKDFAQYLSVTGSCPLWLVQLWLSEYDADTVKAMVADSLLPKPVTIRAVRPADKESLVQCLRAAGVTVTAKKLVDDAMDIAGFDYLNDLAPFREGRFVVQDESSMLVAAMAGISPGDTVIDVCAAPGGKSMHAASLGAGKVLARDLTWDKVALIEENVQRLGLDTVIPQLRDATVLYNEDIECADIVFADLPCSGLGVIGRKPDIKYHMTPAQMDELAALQKKILSVVWQYVKPGGTLMYSTCTVNPRENQDNARWFEQNYPFKLVEEKQLLQGVDECDGFFIARFIRDEVC